MKVALYIEDGREQIVLTPETKSERAILSKITDPSRIVKIYEGSFYGCQGGWTRWRDTPIRAFGDQERDGSTIIVISEKDESNDGQS